MPYEDRYKEFEQYLASGEPGVEERARNWSMAIGLQDVDRLKPSEFLLEQAKANIEGKISSEEVGNRLEEYYSQKSIREKAEADGTFEADHVADRINMLLAERVLHFPHWNCLAFMVFFSRAFCLMPDSSAVITSPKVSGFLTAIQSAMAVRILCRNF